MIEYTQQRVMAWIHLTRAHRPIGFYLLLAPVLWALWLAGEGRPTIKNVLIFVIGCFLMRSAGCVMNDYADRQLDGKVARTRNRPLVTAQATPREALWLCAFLLLPALGLVLLTNPLTVALACGGVVLAWLYPWLKRHTHLPQLVLGLAFAWGVLMAYAAELGRVPHQAWLVFVIAALWTMVYDTFYAMADREEDRKAGIRSSAILLGNSDRAVTAMGQVMVLILLVWLGLREGLGIGYQLAVAVGAGMFAYQQYLIRNREPENCLRAFTNNGLFGFVIFAGLFLHYRLAG